MLEEEHTRVFGAYKKKIDLKANLLLQNEQIVEEKKALAEQIAKENSGLSEFQVGNFYSMLLLILILTKERHDRAAAEMDKLQQALGEAKAQLAKTEAAKVKAQNDKKDIEQGGMRVKKEIADMENAIVRTQQDLANKDHVIKMVNDDIANNDERINKLNKEKKQISEIGTKSLEELAAAEEKLDHQKKVIQKLETTFDELEMSVEKEKKARAAMEKDRRRVEGELKIAQSDVEDFDRSRKDVEATILRKDSEIKAMAVRFEDEQTLVGKIQSGIKESQIGIEELEEELKGERHARNQAERQRSALAKK